MDADLVEETSSALEKQIVENALVAIIEKTLAELLSFGEICKVAHDSFLTHENDDEALRDTTHEYIKVRQTIRDAETEVMKYHDKNQKVIKSVKKKKVKIDSSSERENTRDGADVEDDLSLGESAGRSSAKSEILDALTAMKMPVMEIEEFNGDPLKFQEFWDAFNATYHSNTTLKPSQKLSQLKRKCKGQARDFLKACRTEDALYEEARTKFEQQFGKPRILIRAYVHKLLELEGTKESDTVAMRKVLNATESIIAALKNLGIDTKHSSELILMSIIEKKNTREAHKELGKVYNSYPRVG